jgi:hypothetical protein
MKQQSSLKEALSSVWKSLTGSGSTWRIIYPEARAKEYFHLFGYDFFSAWDAGSDYWYRCFWDIVTLAGTTVRRRVQSY